MNTQQDVFQRASIFIIFFQYFFCNVFFYSVFFFIIFLAQEKEKEKVQEKVQEKEKEKVPEKEEVVRNICPQFLLGQCRTKKCPGLHFALPYCWQFKLCNSTVSWCNFKKIDCVNIEKYFCDVNCTDAGLNISTNISGCESRYVGEVVSSFHLLEASH